MHLAPLSTLQTSNNTLYSRKVVRTTLQAKPKPPPSTQNQEMVYILLYMHYPLNLKSCTSRSLLATGILTFLLKGFEVLPYNPSPHF